MDLHVLCIVLVDMENQGSVQTGNPPGELGTGEDEYL